jgi:hypothetical protein
MGRRDKPRQDTTVRLPRPPKPGEKRLRLMFGNEEHFVGWVQPRLTIGRDPDNHISIAEEFVSRRHATLEQCDSGFRIEDSSSNGTLVVSGDALQAQIDHESTPLEGNGQIFLGHLEGPRIDFTTEVFALEPLGWQPAEPSAEEPGSSDDDGLKRVFRQEGDYWTLQFDGPVLRLKDTKGLRLIAHLLRNPSREFHALELASIVSKGEASQSRAAKEVLVDGHVSDESGAGPILDPKAKADYKRRLSDLRDELAEAEEFNDTGRVARLRHEIEFLTRQLTEAVGLGGRDRPNASNAERARVMVTHRIRDTLKKIRQGHPSLGSHLEAAIKTGVFCSYRPVGSGPIDWLV